MNSVTVYQVHANHVDRQAFLGLATGCPEDIAAYFADQEGYGLEITKANIIAVPEGYAAKRTTLLEKRKQLEAQLKEIQQQLKLTNF